MKHPGGDDPLNVSADRERLLPSDDPLRDAQSASDGTAAKSTATAEQAGQQPSVIIWSMKDVTRKTTLSRATIYREIARGNLDQPIRLSKGRVGFDAMALVKRLSSRHRRGP